jgi:hypothetical protein
MPVSGEIFTQADQSGRQQTCARLTDAPIQVVAIVAVIAAGAAGAARPQAEQQARINASRGLAAQALNVLGTVPDTHDSVPPPGSASRVQRQVSVAEHPMNMERGKPG